MGEEAGAPGEPKRPLKPQQSGKALHRGATSNRIEPMSSVPPTLSSRAWDSRGTPRGGKGPSTPRGDEEYDADAALDKLVSTPPVRKPMLSPIRGREQHGPALDGSS